jgi:hypothetical protein
VPEAAEPLPLVSPGRLRRPPHATSWWVSYRVGGRLRITPEALAEWKELHAVVPRAPTSYEPRPAASRGGRELDSLGEGHHHFTIDPDVRRERAIRSYAAVAFKPVGVLRSYGRKPEAGWGDGLLRTLSRA